MAGERILIVEDNPMSMELIHDLLEVHRYTILQAWDAAKGIEVARTERPDLILMDIQLPGMDGLTATRVLKRDARTLDIPVVALTAYAMKGDEVKALEAGCAGYIPKPIDTREFVGTVQSYLPGS